MLWTMLNRQRTLLHRSVPVSSQHTLTPVARPLIASQSAIYGSTFPDTRKLKELQMENLSPGDLESNVETFLRPAISNPGQKNLWFLLLSAEYTDQIRVNRGESSAETRLCTGRGEIIRTSFPHQSVSDSTGRLLLIPFHPLLHQ